jgi:hypothetical protein
MCDVTSYVTPTMSSLSSCGVAFVSSSRRILHLRQHAQVQIERQEEDWRSSPAPNILHLLLPSMDILCAIANFRVWQSKLDDDIFLKGNAPYRILLVSATQAVHTIFFSYFILHK